MAETCASVHTGQVVDLIKQDDWDKIFSILDQGGTNTKIPK
jgi:hypothetical protein